MEKEGQSATRKGKRERRKKARKKIRIKVCAAARGIAAFLFSRGVVKASAFSLSVAAIFCASSCAIVARSTEETRKFFLSRSEITIFVGESGVIGLNAYPATGEKIAAKWFSHDESVVKVDEGKLTGIAEGETFVGVRTAEYTLFCRVVVQKK